MAADRDLKDAKRHSLRFQALHPEVILMLRSLLGNVVPTVQQIDASVAAYLTDHPPTGGNTTTGSTAQVDLVVAVTMANQRQFPLPAGNQRTLLFVNGEKARTDQYSIVGTVLTWRGGYPLDSFDRLVLTDEGVLNTVASGAGQDPIRLTVLTNGQNDFALPSGNKRSVLFVSGERADVSFYTIANNTLTWTGYYLLDTSDELLLV